MIERPDWAVILDLIPSETRVLELGCGDGALLVRLLERKAIHTRGVEKNEANVRACVARGLSVRHGDIEEGLADFADQAFEYVVLSQTLAYLRDSLPVLREMLRVARFGIVSFQNAGYWRVRLRALSGRGAGHPLRSGLPPIRSITLPQFREVLGDSGLVAEKNVFLTGPRRARFWPRLLAETIIVVIASNNRTRPSDH